MILGSIAPLYYVTTVEKRGDITLDKVLIMQDSQLLNVWVVLMIDLDQTCCIGSLLVYIVIFAK